MINARTDVVLFGKGDLDDVRARAEVYAEAGADCLFVPGLVDPEALRALTAEVPLPVNVMAGPGAPSVAELAEAGVRRVSVGTAIAQAAYTAAQRAARELLDEGTYGFGAEVLDYGTLNGLFVHSG